MCVHHGQHINGLLSGCTLLLQYTVYSVHCVAYFLRYMVNVLMFFYVFFCVYFFECTLHTVQLNLSSLVLLSEELGS
jgi:hypothetical protein